MNYDATDLVKDTSSICVEKLYEGGYFGLQTY
jgi:hypothetical protein